MKSGGGCSCRNQLPPVFGGRLARDFFEDPIEVRQRLETDFVRNFADPQVSV